MSTNELSPAEARQVVERIARGYGWISNEAREATHLEALDAINILQGELGTSVRT